MTKAKLGTLALMAYAFAASAFAGVTCEPDDCLPVALPEPGSLGLLAAGIAGVIAVRLMRRK